jgi:uncharacterized damage-inducible protein DinB
MKTEILKQHLDYTEWASRRLLEAAAPLSHEELTRDFRTSDRSVIDTLAHVFAGDRMWLSRVRGAPRAVFIEDSDRSLEALGERWPEVHSGWRGLMAGETDESVRRLVGYRDLKGNAWETPLWQIVLHMVNHGTHHRGQVSGFLRAMGHTPPPLDLIAYYRIRQ